MIAHSNECLLGVQIMQCSKLWRYHRMQSSALAGFVTICTRHNERRKALWCVIRRSSYDVTLNELFSECRDLICHLCQLPSFRDIIARHGSHVMAVCYFSIWHFPLLSWSAARWDDDCTMQFTRSFFGSICTSSPRAEFSVIISRVPFIGFE